MDVIANLGLGFAVALTLQNIAYCFLGVLLGTVIGVLPGIGPVTTVAMLLPISFTLQPESALILLAGIYYGAQYGGSTTAILVNIPGEATSVVTVLDGHPMARQGRAGIALGIAAIGSFIAGTISTLVVAALGVPLSELALWFGPPEYFSLMVLGLTLAIVLVQGSLLKAGAMVLLGLLLSRWAPIWRRARTGSPSASTSSPTASTSPCWRWACSASPRCCATCRASRCR